MIFFFCVSFGGEREGDVVLLSHHKIKPAVRFSYPSTIPSNFVPGEGG
jgi:hypothetical protein